MITFPAEQVDGDPGDCIRPRMGQVSGSRTSTDCNSIILNGIDTDSTTDAYLWLDGVLEGSIGVDFVTCL